MSMQAWQVPQWLEAGVSIGRGRSIYSSPRKNHEPASCCIRLVCLPIQPRLEACSTSSGWRRRLEHRGSIVCQLAEVSALQRQRNERPHGHASGCHYRRRVREARYSRRRRPSDSGEWFPGIEHEPATRRRLHAQRVSPCRGWLARFRHGHRESNGAPCSREALRQLAALSMQLGAAR